MQKKILCLTILMMLSMFSTGCTTRLIDFTVISSKNIDWSHASEFRRANQRAQGIDLVHIIILIPTGVPNMKEAVDRAIESVPGAVALVDGVLSHRAWYIPYIYGQESYIIEGTPLIDPRYASEILEEKYRVTQISDDGSLKKTKTVTEQEYAKLRSSFFPK